MKKHSQLSINGALRNWTNSKWEGVLSDDNGKTMTPAEVKFYLKNESNKGRNYLPFCSESECPDFDYVNGTGCPGHPDAEESQIHRYPQWDHSDMDRWRENNAAQQTQWDEFLRAMQSGVETEIDAAMWDYWLGVLPPARWHYQAFAAGEIRFCNFGFAEGRDYITAFWRDGERFFCAQTMEMNDG